ncbi:MAG TPA: mechanosensitive ion channel family protein [Thermoanaerobaculia bacterium]|nr:mechanosensitive ion channel family protein [Thermoanaerobaculia bacterium]
MAPTEEKAKAEQLKTQGDVKEALEQATPPPEAHKVPTRTSHRVWAGTWAVLLAVFLASWILIATGVVSLPEQTADILRRASLGAVFIFLVLLAERLAESYFLPRLENTVSRYNLRRVLHLVVGLAIVLIVVTAVFVNWYTAVVSLGLISLILGFSLQAPLTSFIGWVYILIRKPYRVGDRIRIGEAAGDVIDVSYLDTTLWEFGGQYLSSDHPSGRVIKFPNSTVLTTAVYNYSWPLFPYIWNEIRFQIAYDSDLEFVAKTMSEVAEKELGETMMERVKVYRELLAETPVDALQVQERPVILFRVSDNTWLEAIVRYIVDPKKAGRTKTELIRKMLQRMNAEPDRVGLPRSNLR